MNRSRITGNTVLCTILEKAEVFESSPV